MEAVITGSDKGADKLSIWPSDYPKDMAWLPCRCLCFAAPEPLNWTGDAEFVAWRFMCHSIGQGGQDMMYDWNGAAKQAFYEQVTTKLLLADCDGPASVAAAGHMEEAKAQFLLMILGKAWQGAGGYCGDFNVAPGGFWSGPEKLKRAVTEKYNKSVGSVAEQLLFPAGCSTNAAGVDVFEKSGLVNYQAEIFKHALMYLAQHKDVRQKQQQQFAALHHELFGAAAARVAAALPRENI